jgi:hypothetical protein
VCTVVDRGEAEARWGESFQEPAGYLTSLNYHFQVARAMIKWIKKRTGCIEQMEFW